MNPPVHYFPPNINARPFEQWYAPRRHDQGFFPFTGGDLMPYLGPSGVKAMQDLYSKIHGVK